MGNICSCGEGEGSSSAINTVFDKYNATGDGVRVNDVGKAIHEVYGVFMTRSHVASSLTSISASVANGALDRDGFNDLAYRWASRTPP